MLVKMLCLVIMEIKLIIFRPKLFLGLVRRGPSLAICLLLRFVDE